MRGDRKHSRGARRILPLAGVGVVAALGLTGCGADAADGPQAWAAARTQLEEADSVRLSSEFRPSESAADFAVDVPDTTEFAGPVNGSTMSYTAEYRDGARTTRSENRTVDGQTYTRLTLDDRDGVAGDRPEYAEKWAVTPAAGDAESTGMGALVRSLLTTLPDTDALRDAEFDADTLRRSGQDAVRYVLEDPAAVAVDPGMQLTAFTVSQDDGELLSLETEGAQGANNLTFADWDAVAEVQAPAPEELAAAPEAQPAG